MLIISIWNSFYTEVNGFSSVLFSLSSNPTQCDQYTAKTQVRNPQPANSNANNLFNKETDKPIQPCISTSWSGVATGSTVRSAISALTGTIGRGTDGDVVLDSSPLGEVSPMLFPLAGGGGGALAPLRVRWPFSIAVWSAASLAFFSLNCL